MSGIGQYAKSIVGALVAGLSALVVALDDGTVNQQETVTCVIAFLVALGAVWAIPNARKSDPPA